MLDAGDYRRLDGLFDSMRLANTTFLGYPFARGFDYKALWRFLDLTANNLGDPFVDGCYRVDSREMEREVVRFFAELFNADAGDFWGYVTNGGTEGNIYGLYLARQLYPKGIVYSTRETHYSVGKAIHLLGLESVEVDATSQGEMDYFSLVEKTAGYRQCPAIVVANIGTTMKEARDDIRKIRQVLDEVGVRESYVHCDAALCGPFAPFLDPRPAFDFSDGADSITISGHKFIGAPMPCGIVVTRKTLVDRVSREIKYIGSSDSTLGGSRNGFTPILLWYAVQSLGREGLRTRMLECQEVAAYAVDRMTSAGIPAWRNPGALTVVFPKAGEGVQKKWQLATDNVSHLIAMPGTTRTHVDMLVESMLAEREPRNNDQLEVSADLVPAQRH